MWPPLKVLFFFRKSCYLVTIGYWNWKRDRIVDSRTFLTEQNHVSLNFLSKCERSSNREEVESSPEREKSHPYSLSLVGVGRHLFFVICLLFINGKRMGLISAVKAHKRLSCLGNQICVFNVVYFKFVKLVWIEFLKWGKGGVLFQLSISFFKEKVNRKKKTFKNSFEFNRMMRDCSYSHCCTL